MVVLHNFIFGGLTTKLALSWHWAVPRPDCTSIHFLFLDQPLRYKSQDAPPIAMFLNPHHLFQGKIKKTKPSNAWDSLLSSAKLGSPKMAFSKRSIIQHLVVQIQHLVLSFIKQVGTDTVRKVRSRATHVTPKPSHLALSFPLYILKTLSSAQSVTEH